MKEKFVDFLVFWFRKIPGIFFINLWKTYFEDEITDFENEMCDLGGDVVWTSWNIYRAEYTIFENKRLAPWGTIKWFDAERNFLSNEKIKQSSDKGWFYFEEEI